MRDDLRRVSARPVLLTLLAQCPPEEVFTPTSAEEVVDAMRQASSKGLTLWPLGAGIHARPPESIDRPYAVLDTRGLVGLREGHAADTSVHPADRVGIDVRSALVEVGVGVSMSRLEAALGPHGLTARHLGRPVGAATVGGVLSAPVGLPPTFSYPCLRGACVGLTAHASVTERYTYTPAPRKASGPDLRSLFLGNEGRAGVITSVFLSVAHEPRSQVASSWRFESAAAALDAAGAMLSRGLRPWRMCAGIDGRGAELAFELAGDAALVAASLATATEACRGFGGNGGEADSALLDAVAPDFDLAAEGCWSSIRALLPVLRDGARAEIDELTPFGGRVHLWCSDEDVPETSTSLPWASHSHSRARPARSGAVAALQSRLGRDGLWQVE